MSVLLNKTMKISESATRFLSECENLGNEMEQLHATYVSTVKSLMQSKLKFIFDTYPEVQTIRWTQYTPEYCDGGPCNFYCNATDFSLNGMDQYEIESRAKKELANPEAGTLFDAGIGKPSETASLREAAIVIRKLFSRISSDTFRNLFGDPVEVTVTKDGIDIDCYEEEY